METAIKRLKGTCNIRVVLSHLCPSCKIFRLFVSFLFVLYYSPYFLLLFNQLNFKCYCAIHGGDQMTLCLFPR